MKKILKGVLLSILCIVVVAGLAIYFFLTGGEKEIKNLIVTDAAGSTYRIHIDEDKKTTYALVTDENGNVWGADFDGDTVGGPREPLSDIYCASDVPAVNYTGEHMDFTANADDYLGGTPSVTPSQPDNQGANPDGTPLEAYRIRKYQELFAGGRFLINVTMIENGVAESPAIIAVKNGNFYVSTEAEGLTAQMIYMASNDTVYMLIDFLKKYCEVPDDMLEGMDLSTVTSEFQIKDVGQITVSEVELNGKKLICESYISSEGESVSYYFDENDMLVRRDWVYPSGKTDTMVFSQITTEVDDSLFEIPKGYGYLNLSWLLAMGS